MGLDDRDIKNLNYLAEYIKDADTNAKVVKMNLEEQREEIIKEILNVSRHIPLSPVRTT